MIKSEFVKVKWWYNNRNWYKNKGYIFSNWKDEFYVNVEDLSLCSTIDIEIECDYCHKVFSVNYVDYLKNKERTPINKDCCKECRPIKTKETMMLRYGKHTAQLSEVREKYTNTCIDKYGVSNATKTKEVQNKMKNTMVEKYGVEHIFQSDEFIKKYNQTIFNKYGVTNISQLDSVKEKKKETCMNNYGVDVPLRSAIIKNKSKKTMLNKYGVEYPSQSEEIRSKMAESYYKNGSCPTSSQQIKIYELLKNNNYNVELNYPVSKCNLDIALFIDDMKIDIEYDGNYWHSSKIKEDNNRDIFIINSGWKVIRLKADNEIPTLEQLNLLINKITNININKIVYNLKGDK